MNNNSQLSDISEFHWMMDMLQVIDVGIVVLDRNFKVRVWNAFMESHSSKLPSDVRDRGIFELFPDLDEKWFRNKCRPVFDFKGRAFITWEQRPYLFKFPNYRPITGTEDFMYQNITISPITNMVGKVEYVCVMIYDMTDVAANRKRGEALEVTLNELQEKLAKSGL